MKFISFCLIGFSLCSLSSGVFSATTAKECTDFSLVEVDGSMAQIPVDNQGRNGLCYAFAASHLLDAWRQTHAGPREELERISSIAAGILHSSIKDKTDYDGGSPCLLIETLRKEGICGESRLPTTTTTGRPMVQVLDLMEKAHDQRHKAREVNVDKIISELLLELHKVGLQPHLIPSVSHTRNLLERSDRVDFIRGILLERNCHPYKFEIAVPRCRTVKTYKERPAEMLEQWDRLWGERNPQPIGINYNSGVLTQKKGGAHASLVVGRRWHKGRCEYLVHNSWGNNCSKYPWDCEGGRVWVPGTTLAAKVGGGFWYLD